MTMTRWFGDDDEDENEQKGGAPAGDYQPPEDLPIPGENEPLDNSKQ